SSSANPTSLTLRVICRRLSLRGAGRVEERDAVVDAEARDGRAGVEHGHGRDAVGAEEDVQVPGPGVGEADDAVALGRGGHGRPGGLPVPALLRRQGYVLEAGGRVHAPLVDQPLARLDALQAGIVAERRYLPGDIRGGVAPPDERVGEGSLGRVSATPARRAVHQEGRLAGYRRAAGEALQAGDGEAHAAEGVEHVRQ